VQLAALFDWLEEPTEEFDAFSAVLSEVKL
jgi:hypothetical protein